MQPSRPQPQRSPPIRTTTWPISPATPRPSHGLPSSTIPPPTPVPQKTPIRDLYGRPAPSLASASVATPTSLPTDTRVPSESDSHSPSPNDPSQPGRFLACETVPVSVSTSPGEPTPAALSEPGSVPPASAASRSASDICSATFSGLPSVGVGRRDCPTTFHSSSTTTAWILVPPRSIPPRSTELTG